MLTYHELQGSGGLAGLIMGVEGQRIFAGLIDGAGEPARVLIKLYACGKLVGGKDNGSCPCGGDREEDGMRGPYSEDLRAIDMRRGSGFWG